MFTTTILTVLFSVTPDSYLDIVYPEYVFTPPLAQEYEEVVLENIPVFIAEDTALPLISVTATFRGGGYLIPNENTGAVSMMASLLRSGGTTTMTAEEVDEAFAFLAAVSSVSGGGTTVTATLNSLSSNFEKSFDLFLNMLQNPAFQASRVSLEKDSALEGMKQRNDESSAVLRRENTTMLFGDSYMGRNITQETLESIGVDILRSTHQSIVNPTNLVLSISGDFDKENMLAYLSTKLHGWSPGSLSSSPPDVASSYVPGVYYIHQDVPQGGVRICIRTLRLGDPDVEAAEVMNYILGGGGFSSRITQTVRSDEGLAYSAGSQFSPGVWSDGLWAAGYESKSETVALAARLVFDEINRIKTELISDEDLALAKNATIEQFPSMFKSKSDTLGVFVSDYLTNRDSSYWETYRNKIKGVTKEDVRRVANKILKPEEMFVLVVGNWDKIKIGDVGGRANMNDIKEIIGGDITELPLRDPLTLEIKNQ